MGLHASIRRGLTASAAALAVTILAACGTTTTSSNSASSGTTGTTSPSTGGGTAPTASPAVTRNEAPSLPGPVLGTVSARQGECLLFTPGDMAGTWVLTGAIDGLEPGDQVEVTGMLSDVMDPKCPQGVPMKVTKVVKK